MQFSTQDLKITLRERKFDILWLFFVIFIPFFVIVQGAVFVVMILTDEPWFGWLDGVWTGLICCLSYIYLRDIHRTRKKLKIERALSATLFAIEEGQYALVTMRRSIRDKKAKVFYNAFEDARDAFNFGLENYRKAQSLSTAMYKYTVTYTVRDTVPEDLEELEELRTKLFQKATRDYDFAELLEQFQLVRSSEMLSEEPAQSGALALREPIDERFRTLWEKIRPGELAKWTRRSVDADLAARREMEHATMTELTAKSWNRTTSDDRVQWND